MAQFWKQMLKNDHFSCRFHLGLNVKLVCLIIRMRFLTPINVDIEQIFCWHPLFPFFFLWLYFCCDNLWILQFCCAFHSCVQISTACSSWSLSIHHDFKLYRWVNNTGKLCRYLSSSIPMSKISLYILTIHSSVRIVELWNSQNGLNSSIVCLPFVNREFIALNVNIYISFFLMI